MSAKFKFIKLQGCGNNFVVGFKPHSDAFCKAERIKRLLDPNFGIGGDGLLLVNYDSSQNADLPIRLEMYNPDGSPMGMCGNGIRCICRYLILSGVIPVEQRQVQFITDQRLVECKLFEQGTLVELNMGKATFDPIQVPVLSDQPMVSAPLTVAGETFEATILSVGNPHCVIFVPALEKIDVRKLGPLIENHNIFPQRVNVEFAQIVSQQLIKLIVWERGAGLTLACGSGACATVAAGVKSRLCAENVELELPGGRLFVRCDKNTQDLYLKGPALEIYRGEIEEEI